MMRKKKPIWNCVYSKEISIHYAEALVKAIGKLGFTGILPSRVTAIILPEGPSQACYVKAIELQDLTNKAMKRYTKSKTAFKTLERGFNSIARDYHRTTNSIVKQKLDKLNPKKLKSFIVLYNKKLVKFTAYVWLIHVLNDQLAHKVKQILIKKAAESGTSLTETEVLYSPDKISASAQLEQEAYKLKMFNSKDIERLTKSYGWMPCEDLHKNPWREEDLIKYIRNSKQPQPVSANDVKAVMKRLGMNKTERDAIDIYRSLLYLKELRDDYQRMGIYNIQKLYTEIGIRMGFTLKQIAYLREDEVLRYLDKNKVPDKEIVRNRQKGYLLAIKNDKLRCKVGRDAKKTVKELQLTRGPTVKRSVVSGLAASKGIAVGKVKIVHGPTELAKIEQGDIMVAPFTRPDYLPAMQKCAAIVTDEGGLTSHAAILSREMKIPCVTGTKNGTKLFNDGDIVKVDATKGIVEKA